MAEEEFGLESIMCSTPKLDVISRRLSAYAVWQDVMKLKESPLGAAVGVLSDESTSAAVPGPHLSPDFGRDVT
jgi:hypothetical protein